MNRFGLVWAGLLLALLMATAASAEDYNLDVGGHAVSFTLTEATPIAVTGPDVDGNSSAYSVWANETSDFPIIQIVNNAGVAGSTPDDVGVALYLAMNDTFFGVEVYGGYIGVDNVDGAIGAGYLPIFDYDMFMASYTDGDTHVILAQDVPSGIEPYVFEDLLNTLRIQ